ncbi:DNA repair protein RecN [uncultured Eudoraea sp.]|uniref:DNA repair protein RecN n=1 Tax=uncultured Eudoraea sp. TaxID=1035614 RepID=UPI00262587B4|nr:DNA repair protein RecN [uncultured Eudoraea sp.]
MLINLSIKNYALIDSLNVTFTSGFTTITGETGAGKSILLGGLSLVLGKRADMSSLKDKANRCIIEAVFDIKNYNLESFFEKYDLEYDPNTIIRREIHPGGKSRAFVNDSPLTLDILTKLGKRLIDIHSQHQTLQLTEHDYQLKMLDAFADNTKLLDSYTRKLHTYKTSVRELDELTEFQKNANKEYDYNTFLLDELDAVFLEDGLQENLEETYQQLNNVELILENLSKGNYLLNDENRGIISMLSELKQVSAQLSATGNKFEDLRERIDSVFIEIKDIAEEMQTLQESVEPDPAKLEEISNRLKVLYDLQRKHDVSSVSELLEVKENIAAKVGATQNLEEEIETKRNLLLKLKKDLDEDANLLTSKRADAIPEIKEKLEISLHSLGLPNATFKIEIIPTEDYKSNGRDTLSFLFSANKGSDYNTLKKVASGGELSRIMLVIKSILARYEQLPTLMFDEIDSGVSGEISNRMGDIMHDMSKYMQVFSITHLPQIASKGDHHFKVFKTDKDHSTLTQVRELLADERVFELAEMLGGKNLSDSALAHARELLN